jgi:hypothetical protein
MSTERTDMIELIEQARASGARQSQACKAIGISAKTFQRWVKPDNQKDGRLEAKHAPKNKLTIIYFVILKKDQLHNSSLSIFCNVALDIPARSARFFIVRELCEAFKYIILLNGEHK